MARSNDVMYMAEYIKNILYFAIVRQDKQIESTPRTHYFCIDHELVYENYYADFGPLNLGCVYKYCKSLSEKLKFYLNKQIIVHYASSDPKKAANAAYLMGCYGVLHLGLSPKDAMKPLTMNGTLTYRPFQDATQGSPVFTITILDCLKGIKKAQELGFFNLRDFNYEEYNRLDKIAGGDLNWIVPGKFLAFIGPVDFSVSLYHPPEMYIDYFLEHDVKIVIRLNKRLYDENVFSNVGITHHDLFFADGSCPPRNILFKFLQLSEDTKCAIAVHCKAGLGRTGSLIGSYLIKHYRMTAREAIGWMRICRPGSVIGAQQGWLEQLEKWLTKQGNLFRKKHFNDIDLIPTHAFGIYSIAENTSKRLPMFFEKARNSPPPIHRTIRPDISPPRPKASRVREAFEKTQKEYDRGMRTHKDSLQEILNKCDRNERSRSIPRHGSGEGEPRTSNTPSQSSTKQSIPLKINTGNLRSRSIVRPNPDNHDVFVRNVKGSRPIPASPSPVRKAVADNRNSQTKVKGTGFRNDRVIRLNQALTITPHNSYRVPANTRDRAPSLFSTAASQGSGPQNRRQLGRSPSPSPSPSRVKDQTRATNTPATNRALAKNSSKSSLKKVLSRLKVVVPRDGSIGACSFGAASLDARRTAPSPQAQRAPRVHSDERTTATQGDLLNCIKFQRRLRDSKSNDDKLNKMFHNKFSISKNTEVVSTLTKWSGGSNAAKTYNYNTSREKPIPSKGGVSPSRPSVSKGRKTVQNTYY